MFIGGCTGPAFEVNTTSGAKETKVGFVAGLMTAMVVGVYSICQKHQARVLVSLCYDDENDG